MSITLKNGEQYSVGESDKEFSIQSISKVLAFSLAIDIYSKSLYKRVGVEPSGNPFNSLVQLEYEKRNTLEDKRFYMGQNKFCYPYR